jgi:DNA/RNA endonuclease G (NUC1)
VYSLFLFILTYCPATLAERQGYTVCYDTQNQRALWTAHTPQPATGPNQRRHWRIDRALNSLPSSAFTNTGFDRGHLTSAADLPNSPDTYLTSNAVPQDPALNHGAWRELENQIRKQRPVKVITGAVYGNCGNAQIEAPCYMYKIAFLLNGEVLAESAQNARPRSATTVGYQ